MKANLRGGPWSGNWSICASFSWAPAEADLKTFDLTGLAVGLGFRNADHKVVVDLDQAGALSRIRHGEAGNRNCARQHRG